MGYKMKYLLILLSMIIFGCASQPAPWTYAYKGSALPDNQEAMLLHHFTNFREVITIDGIRYAKTQEDPKTKFKLLPGMHEIEYYLRWYKRGFVVGTIMQEMKAGHVYILSHDIHGGFLPRNEFATVTLKDETANDIIYEETFIEPTYDEE
jgi:hypothetical protein